MSSINPSVVMMWASLGFMHSFLCLVCFHFDHCSVLYFVFGLLSLWKNLKNGGPPASTVSAKKVAAKDRSSNRPSVASCKAKGG